MGGVYDFSHEKVREVVYRNIGGAGRGLLHWSDRVLTVSTRSSDAQ